MCLWLTFKHFAPQVGNDAFLGVKWNIFVHWKSFVANTSQHLKTTYVCSVSDNVPPLHSLAKALLRVKHC